MSSTASDNQLLHEISKKLDEIIALMLIRGRDEDAQIRLLRERGHDWNQIGSLVDLSADAARMRLNSKSRRPKKKD